VTVIGPGGVHLVTSRRRLSPAARTAHDEVAALERWLDDAIDAEVDVIHLRERDLDARLLYELTSRIVARSRGTATRVVVNDRADVAVAAGADGVHLPADGLFPSDVRRLRTGWVVGRSIHAGDDPASIRDVDYLMFGTLFASGSKPPGTAIAGLQGLADVLTLTDRPIIAIGGITPDRAYASVEAGAAGVAAIGLFLPVGRTPEAMGVREATVALRRAISAGASGSRPSRG
jgi:thiamine-phosphate pyrophosphorylase